MPVPDGKSVPLANADGKGGVTSGQSWDVLRGLVRSHFEERAIDLDVETGVILVVAGLQGAASKCRLSPRTVKRRFERAGWSASAFVKNVRGTAAKQLLLRGWRTDRVARALGYTSSSALRRFFLATHACGVRGIRVRPPDRVIQGEFHVRREGRSPLLARSVARTSPGTLETTA
jgi:AraC-like DNA-binding protein